MKTLNLFSGPQQSIPATTSWYLDALGEFRGKQELYTRQSPQKLKVLREHALIESAVSSNRIEGVSVEPSRIQSVLVASKPLFRDRDEEEIRGYRDALSWIHEHATEIPLDENSLKRMHAMARGQIWDAGHYKEKDGDIVERYADGGERVRFKPTPANETRAAMVKLIGTWNLCMQERWVPPAVALAAFNLDFLCIHPFRDGRVDKKRARGDAKGRGAEVFGSGYSRPMVSEHQAVNHMRRLGKKNAGPAVTWDARAPGVRVQIDASCRL